jgi:hypothetical protein
VLLFARDGWLHELEVYSVTHTPLPLPSANYARLRRHPSEGTTP